MTDDDITAKALTLAFHYFTTSRYKAIVPNAFIDAHEWDICGVRKSGYIDEIEIKLSRSDFLADFKKTSPKRVPIPSTVNPPRMFTHWKSVPWPKHDMTSNGERKCNYFWYLMPSDLVDCCLNDIPLQYGVIAASRNKNGHIILVEARTAKRMHKEKHGDDRFTSNVMRLCAMRYWEMAHRQNIL